MRAKLSQHFLFDGNILNKIVNLSGLKRGESVIEIGAGMGTLTEVLLPDAKRICAFELDRKLVSIMKERFSRKMNLEIIQGNFLKFNLADLKKEENEKFRVIANIPYAITTDIISKLINNRKLISSATLTVQKEYGERLVGKPGTKKYSALTVFVNSYADIDLLFKIQAAAFSPAPKVDSVVVKLDWNVKEKVLDLDSKKFSLFVKLLFSERRKQLKNSLKIMTKLEPEVVEGILEKLNIPGNIRPEKLLLDEFIKLFKEVYGNEK
ncbi:ribosomal RNA small subunit methyltransferase A [Candidatus Dependentiae bacterium]|nr:ribosomal RNA small subunit methyltransferase A [Candidatus Dependentiae bacterium]